MIRKQYDIEVQEKRENGGRILINTGVVDRDKDRVLPSGAKTENYMRNPVVQWAHNYYDPWATAGKTNELIISPEGIIADFDLRPAANEHDPQNVILLLWNGEWINAASIGFMPARTPREGGGTQWTAEDNEHGGKDFTDWELIEWSLVPIPANQEALRNAVKALGDEPEGTQTVTLTCRMCGGAYKASATLADLNLTGLAAQLCLKCVASFERNIVHPNQIAANVTYAHTLGVDCDCEQCKDVKPYANEHACRLRSPGDFQSDSFRRVNRESDGKRYGVIMGRLTGESTMTEQAYRYPKDVWAVGEARSHCKEHGGQTFEPAEGQESLDANLAAKGDDPAPPDDPPPEELDAPEEVDEEVLGAIAEFLDAVESELLPEKE